MSATSPRTIVFVGTYNRGEGPGIFIFECTGPEAPLRPLSSVAGVANPSFLALAPGGRFLYAVCEVDQSDSKPMGAVAAFAIEPGSWALRRLNQQPSQGRGPCHLSTDATGRVLLVANYSDGSVASFPLAPDGTIGPAASVIRHQGSSVDPERQARPHAHMIAADPANRFVFAADLGLDKLLCYRLDAGAATLSPGPAPFAKLPPGAGPRHFAFAPDGRYVYVINELDSTMTTFAYEAEHGKLSRPQTVPTLPPGWQGRNYPADVHVSPDGRFVYGSNRGHDSIAIFAADRDSGALTPRGHEPTGGKEPRNFNLSPRGDWLLAANQNSDTLVAFRIDPTSGALRPTGQRTSVPAPVCVQMLEL